MDEKESKYDSDKDDNAGKGDVEQLHPQRVSPQERLPGRQRCENMTYSLFAVAGRYAAGDGELPTVYSGKQLGARRRRGCSMPQSKSTEMEVECEEKEGKGIFLLRCRHVSTHG